MTYSVEYSSHALKALEKLDRATAALITGWIDKNLVGCDNPRQYGRALSGDLKGYWMYRIGSYRLIAEIHDYIVRVVVVNIGRRRDAYRQ